MTDLDHQPDLVRLDVDLGARQARRDPRAGRRRSPTPAAPTDADQLAADALAREGTSADRAARRHRHPALPHRPASRSRRSRSPGSRPTVDFGAKDGPADLAFLIAAPAGGDATHLQLLTKLARALVKTDFTDGAARAPTTPAGGRRPGQRGVVAGAAAARRRPRRRPPLAAAGAAPRRRDRRHPAARRWSPSPRARPASRTPTWPPRPSRPPPRGPASTIAVETQGSAGSTPLRARDHRRGRRRDLRRRRRACATAAGSPASRWSPPASSARSTTPTR